MFAYPVFSFQHFTETSLTQHTYHFKILLKPGNGTNKIISLPRSPRERAFEGNPKSPHNPGVTIFNFGTHIWVWHLWSTPKIKISNNTYTQSTYRDSKGCCEGTLSKLKTVCLASGLLGGLLDPSWHITLSSVSVLMWLTAGFRLNTYSSRSTEIKITYIYVCGFFLLARYIEIYQDNKARMHEQFT